MTKNELGAVIFCAIVLIVCGLAGLVWAAFWIMQAWR